MDMLQSEPTQMVQLIIPIESAYHPVLTQRSQPLILKHSFTLNFETYIATTVVALIHFFQLCFHAFISLNISYIGNYLFKFIRPLNVDKNPFHQTYASQGHGFVSRNQRETIFQSGIKVESESHSVPRDHDEFDFGEVLVHQLIHIIKFVHGAACLIQLLIYVCGPSELVKIQHGHGIWLFDELATRGWQEL
ncbi:hypothetical protein DEO72_LG11g3672 [Vigna unguiculata]|uniref:Uncharacterized protein n=1 Tax=Vigna unguiculata TaxID=3917 RepID=A0A4D6NVB5_VIGUN|nr:hypothetical protein DEO72_LG11g3672 [Vigna unguiculata]